MPHKVSVDVTKCHAKKRGVTACQARHRSQLSAVSATPASKGNVDVTKCHACHTKSSCHQVPRLPRKKAHRRGGPARHQSQLSAVSAKCSVDVTKCLPTSAARRRGQPPTRARPVEVVSGASNRLAFSLEIFRIKLLLNAFDIF